MGQKIHDGARAVLLAHGEDAEAGIFSGVAGGGDNASRCGIFGTESQGTELTI
jgi:hypothetical protein